jgi:NAD(P)-dependent dehydrogenase (short-subunit alcohol dehydrogenase family)
MPVHGQFDGRRIVITGASRGIGLASAEFFLESGAEVIGVSRNPANLKTARQKLKRFATAVSLVRGDVSRPATSRKVAREVERRWGACDILVNGAAILFRDGALDEEKEEWLEQTLRVNVLGIHYMIRAILPFLLKGRDPRILNFSSAAALIHGTLDKGDHDIASYRLSKVSVNALTMLYAGRLKGRVSVLSFDPGWIRTEMGGPDAPEETPAAVRRVSESLSLDWKTTGQFMCGSHPHPW